ncbi:RNA 2',3'-cyclic phosphodiesterase [Streptomyces litchfieldiae]|uniref:RNA 2',3'-cyclic phosphodiesterase n=1 Tax=Streptomyces litchfieldiae TaxID=3075543 RepID=A0ABU2MRK6_9ACTN|nr:RNA 2',3'-cyclic phosphodiesterase [Streptomyces sp. DSM 44938]MDT0343239.1 RNA 2',3'-cyclic phosphodiesterase [Streptomyces sp. DSM 44938]
MRLFAAVLPPPEAVAELETAVRESRALPEADRLRWAEPDGWHITLAFYGETDPGQLPGLYARLAEAALTHEPFPLRLTGCGTFGDRVLWAGVGGATADLVSLATAVGPGVGTHDEYRPHLTLARGRGEPPLTPWTAALAGFAGTGWTARALVLMRSEDDHRYTSQAAWPLGVP